MSRTGWESALAVLRDQSLGYGDRVVALPGERLVVDGVEFFAEGDEGEVAGYSKTGEAGDEHVRVMWLRTGMTSEIPKASWMGTCRLVSKGIGNLDEKTKSVLGGLEALCPGCLAKLRGLVSAPELNGKPVRLQRFDKAKNRWLVTIVTDEAVVCDVEKWIKAENLVVSRS